MARILSPKRYLYLNFLGCYSFDMSMNRKMTKDTITKKQWWWIFVTYNTLQGPKPMKDLDQQDNHETTMVPITWQWTSTGLKRWN